MSKVRRGSRRGLSLLLALVLLLGLLPGTAWAADRGAITVKIRVQDSYSFLYADEALIVSPGTAERYGYSNGNGIDEEQVTALDVLVAAHAAYYGSDFTAESAQTYLKVNSSGNPTEMFGNDNTNKFSGFATNHKYPMDSQGTGYLANTAPVVDGDVIDFFYYEDTGWMDYLSWFVDKSGNAIDVFVVEAGKPFEIGLKGFCYMNGYTDPDAEPLYNTESLLSIYEKDGDQLCNVTSEDGMATITLAEDGTYFLTAVGFENNYDAPVLSPLCKVIVKEHMTNEDAVAAAAEMLTVSDILTQNKSLQSLSQNLTLPISTYDTTTITWSLDTQDSEVIGYYPEYGGGYETTVYVGAPKSYAVSATLTATISSTEDERVSVTKSFQLTVPAEEADKEEQADAVDFGSVMSGIAAGWADGDTATSAIADTDLPWAVMDMAAYGAALGNTEQERYAVLLGQSDNAVQAKYVLAEYARKNAVTAPSVPEHPDIWSAPSILLARTAAGIESSGDNTALIACMTGYLTGAERDADTVAAMLAALALYYQEADVKSAVDTAVAWLSAQQSESGTWKGNANSTAMVVVALSALGIDAHTDSRFIKNGKSAVEGLLSFALADNSGFGYGGNVTYNGMATEQGFRALVAYARMKDNNKAYNIYLEAKDSTGAVPAPNITATVKPGGGSGSGGTSKVTITVSVMVPPEGGVDGQYTYAHDAGQYTNLLGSSRKVTVSSGTTALAVLESVLDEAGITYTADTTGYVTTINGLSAFDHGSKSGWRYMVDGTAPLESSASYTFTKNSTLIWYYTDDYTKETDDSWTGGGGQTVVDAAIKEQADGSYQVTLPKGSAGSVLVTIPKVSQGDLLVIVHADGTQEAVKKSVIQDGTAYLLLEENATVKAVDYVSDFNDVKEDAWYAGAVDFVAGRGLFSGVGGGNFAPDGTLSRGMVVTVLYALEEAGAQKSESLFADVAQDAWYAQGTAWAVEAGIVSGYGDGQFGPDDAVTREQLALMLYRYAQSMKLSTGAGASLTSFGDEVQISPWAREAMAWAVSAGVLSGTPEGSLNPAGTATRAEAAVMVNQFVAWMLKG